MKLTEKQRRFADEYVKIGNVTQAAINAGYSKKTAYESGYQNMKKPHIKSYIEKHIEKMSSDSIMEASEALELLTSISRGEMTEEQYIGTQQGVERVVKTPDIKDRQKAIESLLKRYPISKHDELKNKMLETQIAKLEKELQSDTSTEDKLDKYFKKLDGEFDESS